jgi:DNA-binding XRE family transcriptional regulator
MDFTVVAQAGLTQKEFAAVCGVSRVTANTWVRGKMNPHRYIKQKIAVVLDALHSAVAHADLPLKADVPDDQRVAEVRKAVVAARTRT